MRERSARAPGGDRRLTATTVSSRERRVAVHHRTIILEDRLIPVVEVVGVHVRLHLSDTIDCSRGIFGNGTSEDRPEL